jgi:hypothetical protein
LCTFKSYIFSRSSCLDLLNPRLSGLLAEATQDDNYLEWATTSLTFLKNHLFLSRKNFPLQVLGSFDSENCGVWGGQEHHNYGLVIEGLAILYSITRNASLQTMLVFFSSFFFLSFHLITTLCCFFPRLNDVISVAIPKTEWQGKDGIIAAKAEGIGSVELVHGLTAAYERNATSPELRKVVARYLAVQVRQ